ncbi:MAG: AAA family ATPase [Actinoplanes sp.]
MAGKDYAAIARSKITSPGSGRMPRYLVYGRNKKGKTHFCATAPNVLILDPEDGTIAEDPKKADVWPITQWTDLDEVYHFIKGGGKSTKTGEPYKWIALDGMTRMLSMALLFVSNQQAEKDLTRQPGFIDKRTYGQANKMIEGVLHNFHSLRNVGLIITAQERVVEIESMEDLGEDDDATPASYMYVPDLTKGARAPLNQVVDVIGRIYVVRGEFEVRKRIMRDGKPVVVKKQTTTQRRLFVGPHEMYDTGYRSGHVLPDFIKEPSVTSLGRALREGKVTD